MFHNLFPMLANQFIRYCPCSSLSTTNFVAIKLSVTLVKTKTMSDILITHVSTELSVTLVKIKTMSDILSCTQCGP